MRWTTQRTAARETLSRWFFRGATICYFGDWREQDWSILAEYFTHE